MRKFLDIVEQKGQMIFTFGRFNPPTTGHEKLIQKVASVAGTNPFRIYPSQSQNPKKDPLPFALKVAYMRKMFPRYAKNIVAGKERQVFEIVSKLYSEGYRDIVMVVGSDRVKEFDSLIKKYNGVNGRHGFYDFKTIDVISAGERDPDAEGVTGMSASKMRAAATMGDFDQFKLGLPSGFRDALKLYNDVRKYMGIREERDMGDMSDFETLRDLYLTGKIWNVGDIVEAHGVKGKVIRKGTNYLSFVDEDNKVHKAWLHDIDEQKKITRVKQEPDVEKMKGAQPAKYYAKGVGDKKDMSKSTKVSRARHFAKGASMDDDNPAAYKPAPGDKGAKTKPSQYTKKFKQMYGEKDVKIPLELLKLYNQGMKLPAGSTKHKEVMKQIDDMRKKLGIKEKLGKDADAGDYIKDFRKSDAPQFKGKSDKKIRDMAIAAYLDAKDKKEEYIIDESLAMTVKGKGREKYRLGYDQKFTLNGKGYVSTGVTKQQVYVARGPEGEKVFSKKELEQLLKKGDLKFFDMGPINQEEVDMDIYHLDEKIAGLVKKSKQTGIPYGILKKSYDRGMAAWRTGHRPGTTPQQWAFARVNSMVTGGKADPDLQKQAKSAKKAKKEASSPAQQAAIAIDMKKKGIKPKNIQEWFESNRTRASYQLRHGDNWWWKLNEVHDAMLEKIGADCCDDCSEELEEKKFDYFDTKDDAQAHAKKHGGKVFKNTGKGATKVKGVPKNQYVVIKGEFELDEMDMKYVLINMQGKVQGYASDKRDAMDIARRTKSTMHKIKKKISDKTLDKMNALQKTPKELKDLGIIEELDEANEDEIKHLEKMLKDLEKGKKTPGKGFLKIKIRQLIADLKSGKIKTTRKEELDEAMYHHVLKGKIVASGSKSKMQSLVKKNGKTVFKGPDSNYVLNSPGAKIGDIKEQPEHEITVGNYTTKFFYMCGSAQKVMKQNADVEGAEELTRLQDDFYKLEKEAMDAGEASDEQKEQARELYNKIMQKAGEIGLADDIDDYMKMHIDSVEKGDPKLGFGRTDMNESLWANIHKKRQRIKRGSGEKMRKKGEKGAPTAAQMRRAKGEELMNYIERKMSTLRKDKDLPNLMIPKKGKAGVTKFQKRSGGRSRLDSPYTMMMKNSWGEVTEAAEYQGRKVQLNNPTRGDVKKFKVYVKNDKGNVVKVEFGDPNMEIKRDDPARRKSFRARHNCDNPGPKYKARFWSCKFWEKGKSVTDLMKG